MSLGVVGQKIGMTRVFDDQGVSTPVTAVLVEANRVTQVKPGLTLISNFVFFPHRVCH